MSNWNIDSIGKTEMMVQSGTDGGGVMRLAKDQ